MCHITLLIWLCTLYLKLFVVSLNLITPNMAAGFYICWGCLVWVPSIYTSPGMYLVNHPVNLGTQVFPFSCLHCSIFIDVVSRHTLIFYFPTASVSLSLWKYLFLQLAIFILVAGILCIYINYDCDRQRQEFRRTNGKCKVWGKPPSKVWSYVITLWSGVYLFYNVLYLK